MFHVDTLISSGGIVALIIIGAIVFAESGLLIGFFLPGDSLLFSAGILSAQGLIPLPALLITIIGAAILGDNVGYAIGDKAGPKLFTKKDGLLFRHEHVVRAEKFYEKHGGKTIVLARFIPIIRTFAPVVAGIGKMDRKKFVFFNVFGGLFWGLSVTLSGYFIGTKIPNIEKFIAPTIISIMVLSFGPAIYHLIKDEKIRAAIKQKIKARR